MEDRLTPTQIGQFSFAPGNDYTNTNTGSSDTFGTTASGSPGDFQYQNIANLPSFLQGALASHLILSMSTTTHATETGNTINQSFTTSATVQVILNTALPEGEGAGNRNNLISATFTATLTSTAGQNSATLNSASVTFTSDFLDFTNTTNDAFSEGFTNVSPVTSIVNNFINSFTAAGSANFSTTPVAPLIGADLAVTKTGPATVNAGGTITYTVSVQNNGPVAATNPVWTDSLPAGETLVSVTQSPSGSYTGPTWTNSGSGNSIDEVGNGPLNVETGNGDNVAVFTVVADVATAAYGTLTNTGTVSNTSTTQGDPNHTNNSSSVNTFVVTNPTLTINKTGPATVIAGDQLSYTLTVDNTSTETATNVDVTDPLPSGETFASQSQGSGPSFTLSNTGNSISDTIAALLPGASQTFTIVAYVPSSTASGTIFHNQAGVNWNENEDSGNDNPGSATSPIVPTTVETSADLGITKSATPVILDGGNITYSITVTNSGPSNAQSVQMTDPLPGGTVFVSDSGAAGWAKGDPLVGTNGTITDTIGTLAAGASATFTIVATDTGVAAPNTISNTATIAATTPDSNPNNSSTASTTVELPAALSGTVFEDLNDDGIENGLDAGLTGVVLTLVGSHGNTYTATSTPSGSYSFTNLVPDTYTLTETGPLTPLLQGKNTIGTGAATAGTLTAPSPFNPTVTGIVLNSGSTAINYNFAAIPSATVQGIVFDNSVENDGVFHPATDPGINGVTLTLTGTNDEGNAVSLATTTTTIAGQAGSFAFAGLRPSNGSGYTITETQPAAYVQGKPDTVGGPLFGGTASQSLTQDVVTGIAVGDGSNIGNSPVVSQNYLFPELEPAALSGLVYSDNNDSGTFDSGDTGVNGVTVTVTGTDINGNPVNKATTTTTIAGQAGSYSFTGLEPSNGSGYTITETQPGGYLEGTDNIGSLSGNSGTQDIFSSIPVGVGANGTGYNFGELPPASLAGVVYLDANDNGVFDGGDAGINGVTVTLTGTDINGNPVNLTATTSTIGGQAGSYSFTALEPSNGSGYTITKTPPNGYLEGTDNNGSLSGNTSVQDIFSAIPVGVGASGTGYDFGELKAVSLSGVVFDNSVENDGLFHSATDPGINGVTVTLTGTNDQGTAVSLTTTTTTLGGQAGSYSFTGLRPSNASGYTITDTNSGLPAAYITGKNQDTGSLGGTLSNLFAKSVSGIVVTNGQTGTQYNFGDIQPDSLSGIAYIDTNHLGSFVSADPGINGLTLTLTGTNDEGNPVSLTTTTATIAGQAGAYSFSGLVPSNGSGYTVTETQPSDYSAGTDTVGTPFGGNAPVQTATSNTVAGISIPVGNTIGINYNFGELSSSISGSVFNDSEYDEGLRQPGEPGINSVTITLTGTDIDGNPVSLTTTTSGTTPNDGDFTFQNLPASNNFGYTLTETQPTGYIPGQDNAGTQGGNTNVPDVISRIIVPRGISGVNYTFAQLESTQLSGVVFDNSVEHDGVFHSATDPGINGVTITLTGTDMNGNPVDLTTTTTTIAGQTGSYSFASLTPSNGSGYTLTEIQPNGYLEGQDQLGSLSGTATVQDVFAAIPTTFGSNGTGYNFGELRPATIAGVAFDNSLEHDGVFHSATDPGLNGVTVTLTGTDINGNPVSLTTTTSTIGGQAGSYSFTGLEASNASGYTITETQPSAYLEGKDQVGSLEGNSAVQDVFSAIPTTFGADGTGYTFGELEPVQLSGVVFDNSLEHDGTFHSASDPGLNGVTVTLTGTDINGNPVSVTTTTSTIGGQAGSYAFTGLEASNGSGYTLTETQPSGYLEGKDQLGSLGGSAAVPDVFSAIPTTFGADGTTYNFAQLEPVKLSGVVFDNSLEHDGTFHAATDPGINGVTVTLTGTDINGNPVSLTTTTSTIGGQAGSYAFTGLEASNASGYTITETQQSAYLEGLDQLGNLGGSKSLQDVFSAIPSAFGANGTGYNFGELEPVQLSGVVFDNSLEHDGTFHAATDPGINGVTVTLTGSDINGNPVRVTATTSTIAGQAGSYAFTGLEASNASGYTLTETQPSAYLEGKDQLGSLAGSATVQDVFSAIPTTFGADGTGYNFGELKPASVSGVVFDNSLEHDGVFHAATDPGLNGVTVTLTGTDINGNPVSLTATTSTIGWQAGSYAFTGLEASNASGYTLTETQPSGYLEGQDQLGSLSGNQTVQDVFSAIPTAFGASGTGYNFGELKPASLSGVVFDNSAENDGIFHAATDPGINGVTVTLTGTDINGKPVSLTATTSTIAGQAGSYSFTGLEASNGSGYTITETQPSAYLEGKDQLGSLSGSSSVQDVFSAVPTLFGSSGASYNFGELEPATVSGFVYIDANDNGTKDPTEPGIPGVTVVLSGTNDLNQPVSITLQTQSNGSFDFANLRPSAGAGYTITETQPAGYLAGLDTAGSLTGNVAVQDVISAIPVNAGNDGTNYLFGEQAFTNLSGFVYVDNNNSGVLVPGDPPVAGVTITLTGTNILGNPVALTATTNASGAYSFLNLLPSTSTGYTLSEPQPSQYGNGKDTVGTGAATAGSQTQHGNPNIIGGIVLATSDNAIAYNFGEIGSTVSGTVFIDSNDNGALDSGEPGLGGVTINLFNSAGTPVATTTSASNGTYSFIGLPSGTYTIVETRPNGYGFSSPTTLSNVSVPVAGTVTGENFGNTLGSISGTVYVDINNNGTRDLGEPPVAGATITLTGTDLNGVAVNRTVSSDLTGAFTIGNLLAGTYTLTEPQPTGYTNGKNDLGSAGGTQTAQNANPSVLSAISLSAGVNATNYEFGEIGTVLSGKVFIDSNDSGTLVAGDPGLAGVPLSLINSLGNIQAITSSGPDGSYNFVGLTPNATYSVVEAAPNGYGTSTPTQLSNLTVPTAGLSGKNFGLTLGSLAGYVYVDANKSGARITTDPGIPGTTIILTGTTASGNAVDLTTTTAGDGSYSFSNLVGGSYTITETQPSGFSEGKDTAGSLGGNIATQDIIGSIALGGGKAGTNYNFGEDNPTGVESISGTVYIDSNDNGKLDAGEAGDGGVSITLTGPATKTTTTAANGTYSFTGLTAGSYTITETVPSGFNATSQQVLANVAVAAPGVTGENFGLLSGSLSGTVYIDETDSGVLASGDPGIPGVTVTLSGPVNTTTTTGPNGTYSFANLPSGTYTITETQPVGFVPGMDTAGSLSGSTSVQDVISSIIVGTGGQGTGYNFGELTSGLSGVVYVDLNSDGHQQSGEPGIPGVTVTITGPVTRSTLTAFNGTFSFSDLVPGVYTLTETQSAGYTTTINQDGTAGGTPNPAGTSDTLSNINLTAGTIATGYLFGENAPIVAGTVYLDANDNGTLDSGDTGIGGDTLTLTDTTLGKVVATTTTGKDGSYLFLVPTPGDSYTITETQPAGYGSNERSSDTDNLGAVSSSVLNQNFGKILGSISGTIYADNNINGTQDSGEPGISGVAVKLTGTDINGDPVSLSTVTNASGNFTFANLLTPQEGGYTITQTVPPSDYPGLAGTVGTSSAATHTATQFTGISLAAGVNASGYKFGDILPADPFGFVYVDSNGNGVKDSTEPGLAGVTVTISGTAFAGTALARPLVASDDPSSTPLVRVTNSSGLYEFLTLPPGVYTITETPPTGYIGGKLQNADPLVPPARALVATTTGTHPAFSNIQLVSGDVRGAFNFAELPAGSIAGTAFLDMNADGVYDKGDLLEANVTITLSGLNIFGDPVKLTTKTNAKGVYNFTGLLPSGTGGYKISLTTPAGIITGRAYVGSLGGSLGTADGGPITVTLSDTVPDNGTGYNFSLLPAGKKRLIGS